MTTADSMFAAANASVDDALNWVRSALSVLDGPSTPLSPADGLARRRMQDTLRQAWDLLEAVKRERPLTRAAFAEAERQLVCAGGAS